MRFRNQRIEGRLYDLSHLGPFTFSVSHMDRERTVRVTFSDHVFTEAHDPDRHTPDLIHSRRDCDPRAFNVRRWELSRDLPDLFRTLGRQSVYRSKGRNFFFLCGNAGEPPYAVFFDAIRSSRRKADVSVIVRSTYEKDAMAMRARPVSFSRLIDAVAREVTPPLGPPALIKRRRQGWRTRK